MNDRALIACAALATTLSACGGGQSTLTPVGGRPTPGSPSPIPSQGSRPTGTATVTLTFPIPSAASMGRKRLYLSAKTQSVKLAVATVNGIVTTSVITTTVNVGAGATGCTLTAGALTCAVSIAAPVGNDGFDISTYAFANGVGNPISIGKATATIAAGATASITATFLPVVTSFTIARTPASLPIGVPGRVTLAIAGVDAAGDVIGGTEPYYLPITVNSKDTSGHVTASPALPARITAPGQTIVLAYDGVGTAATYIFDVAVGGDALARGLLPQTQTLAFTGGTEHLYVTEQAANAVLVYDIATDGSLSGPSRTLEGASTGLDRPLSIAVDALGTMYVVNTAKNVEIYSPGSSGNVAPIATYLQGANPQFVALDGTTRFAVGFYPNDSSGKPDPSAGLLVSLTNYSTPTVPGAPYNPHPFFVADIPNVGSYSGGGSLVCAGLQTGGARCFVNPVSGTTDPAGNIIPQQAFEVGGSADAVQFRSDGLFAIANGGIFGQPPGVSTFAPGSFLFDGSLQLPTPKYALHGSNTGFAAPTAIAFDKLGNLYVDDYGQASFQGTVKQFPMNATGNVAPARTIGGLDFNFGIAVGP